MIRSRSIALGAVLLSSATPAVPASPFDGTYQGSIRPNGGVVPRVSARCYQGGPLSVTVTDGRFFWNAGGERVVVQIKPDGSFTAQSGRRFLQGRIDGSAMSADSTTEACHALWTASR